MTDPTMTFTYTFTPKQRENMEAWIAALRSGEYMQGQGTLTKLENDGVKHHCCLGVACVINDIPKRFVDRWTYYDFGEATFSSSQPSLRWMADTFGLDLLAQSRLIRMNDNFRNTFDEIADQLEVWLNG